MTGAICYESPPTPPGSGKTWSVGPRCFRCKNCPGQLNCVPRLPLSSLSCIKMTNLCCKLLTFSNGGHATRHSYDIHTNKQCHRVFFIMIGLIVYFNRVCLGYNKSTFGNGRITIGTSRHNIFCKM